MLGEACVREPPFADFPCALACALYSRARASPCLLAHLLLCDYCVQRSWRYCLRTETPSVQWKRCSTSVTPCNPCAKRVAEDVHVHVYVQCPWLCNMSPPHAPSLAVQDAGRKTVICRPWSADRALHPTGCCIARVLSHRAHACWANTLTRAGDAESSRAPGAYARGRQHV